MRGTRSRWRHGMSRKGRTNWSSSTSRPATRSGISCSMWSAGPPKRFSCPDRGWRLHFDDIRSLLNAGCDKVSINSAACQSRIRPSGRPPVRQPVHRGEHRPETVRHDGSEFWEVHINGGIATGLEAVAWAREVERLGAGKIVLTTMDADGTKDGYDLEITAAVRRRSRFRSWPAGGRMPGTPGGRHPHRQGGRRTGGQHLPLRRIHHSRKQSECMARRGDPGCSAVKEAVGLWH